MRVLIVEDDSSVGELCRRILEDEGYTCALARDAIVARAAIAERPIDLLIADVVLPGGIDGRDLANEVKIAGTPVIFMSGNYQALRELAEAGIAHLQKPFRILELVARVQGVLDMSPTTDAPTSSYRLPRNG
jgi:DNA-binding response OmpR family regulator